MGIHFKALTLNKLMDFLANVVNIMYTSIFPADQSYKLLKYFNNLFPRLYFEVGLFMKQTEYSLELHIYVPLCLFLKKMLKHLMSNKVFFLKYF